MASPIQICHLIVLLLSILVITVHAQGGNNGGNRKKGNDGGQRVPANGRPRPQANRPAVQSNTAGDTSNANGENVKKREVTKFFNGLGRIRGRVIKSEWSGKDIMQFHDIPYGKSPQGPMRFKPSTLADPWDGTLNGISAHADCPSLQNIGHFENLERKNIDVEDCLRLTISTKALSGRAPVMVYIHGDFLFDGSSIDAPPGYLLEEDVVLVAVRYRLGPFGFLSTMSDDIPGNVAVNDIILSLQWIQQHISTFGGNPRRVTLFGQTGGAALINVLTLSPRTPDNLFHGVIYHSATALTPAFIADDPINTSKEIAIRAGCKNINKIEAINRCMRRLNTTALLYAFTEHLDAKAEVGISFYGGAQFVIGGPSGILPAHPGKLLAAGKFKAIPTIGGAVKNPGTFILKDIYIDNFNESIIDDKLDGLGYIDHIIKQTNGADPKGAWKNYAQQEIFDVEDIRNGTFYRMLPGLIDMCSVIMFKNPVLLVLQANAKKLPKNTFLYSFDHVGEFNRYTTSEDDEGSMPFELGVSLADDNLYLFPWPRFRNLNTIRDIKIAKRMVGYWTSFAATGVPKVHATPEWPPMDDETGPYMKIGKFATIAENYLDEYKAAVTDAQMGYNLVNDDFFESLVEVNENGEANEGDSEDLNEGRGTNFVMIARRTKQK